MMLRFARRVFAAICLALALGGCATAPRHPALAGEGATRPPPRLFFANRAASGAHQVSPDGRRLAWIATHGVQPALWVRSLDGEGVERVVAEGVGNFAWAADSRHVLTLRDRGGDENYQLLALDTESPGAVRNLTPWPGVRAMPVHPLQDDPRTVLVLHNRRDRSLFDLYRVRIDTGEQVLVARNPGNVVAVAAGRAGTVLAHVRKDGLRWSLHAGADEAAPARLSWGADDSVQLLSTSPDGAVAWLLSDVGRERRALVRLDLATGATRVLHEDPDVDVEGLAVDPRTGQPLAAYATPDYRRQTVLDAALAADLARLVPGEARQVRLQSLSADLRRLVVVADHDRRRDILLIDRDAGRATPLGRDTVAEVARHVGERRPVRLSARDGLTLHGYLTLPATPAALPRPMVLLVHGGPWARDTWDTGAGLPQFLATRGYAVLQVNYRGSSGYGRRHAEAGVGEFAGRMHDDLLDAVDWAVAQRIADPARIAIVGASYGGYAAMVGMTFTPDRFACGISIAGVSDLVTLTQDFPPYWRPDLSKWHRFVGDPAIPAQRDAMAARSPIHRVGALRAPLLLIQGDGDTRVRRDQGDRFVEAARAQGKPVDYLVLKGVGHQLGSWSTRLRVARATERFLADCLGGADGGMDLFELGAWLL